MGNGPASDLQAIADGSDDTLADFLRAMSCVAAITIRRPSLQVRELLRFWRLDDLVQVADFPGPAPHVPA